jgi:hypothetical protein
MEDKTVLAPDRKAISPAYSSFPPPRQCIKKERSRGIDVCGKIHSWPNLEVLAGT